MLLLPHYLERMTNAFIIGGAKAAFSAQKRKQEEAAQLSSISQLGGRSAAEWRETDPYTPE